MNTRLSNLTFCLLLLAAPAAFAVTVPPTVTAAGNVPGPISLGESFTVTLTIAGYEQTNEIDAVKLNVSYDSSLLEFVGNFTLNDRSGSDEQWLHKPNQNVGSGYLLSNQSDGSTPGNVFISLRDAGSSLTQRGTMATDGFLISFDLRAKATGTSDLHLSPFAGDTGDEALYDNLAFNPVVVPDFVDGSITIVPEPGTLGLLGLGAVTLLVSRRWRK